MNEAQKKRYCTGISLPKPSWPCRTLVLFSMLPIALMVGGDLKDWRPIKDWWREVSSQRRQEIDAREHEHMQWCYLPDDDV